MSDNTLNPMESKNIKDYLHLEQWIEVGNFPKTEVSNLGRVRVKKTGRIINQRLRRDGYMDVRIYHSLDLYKTIKVHRLVAKAFVSGYQPEHVVNHKDFNKTNNFADNLEWITRKENIHHAIAGGHRNDYGGKRFNHLEAAQLAKKKVILNESRVFDSVTELAAYLNVGQSTVSQAIRRGNKILKTNTVRYAN